MRSLGTYPAWPCLCVGTTGIRPKLRRHASTWIIRTSTTGTLRQSAWNKLTIPPIAIQATKEYNPLPSIQDYCHAKQLVSQLLPSDFETPRIEAMFSWRPARHGVQTMHRDT